MPLGEALCGLLAALSALPRVNDGSRDEGYCGGATRSGSGGGQEFGSWVEEIVGARPSDGDGTAV